MGYIIAFDGGGTKTKVGVFDSVGNILFETVGSGSNHAFVGEQKFSSIIGDLFKECIQKTGIKKQDILFVYLGLSGADLPSDFEVLNRLCSNIFVDIAFEIVNDVWIAMRSGLQEPFGAVSICGSGNNAAALNRNGEKGTLRALGYTLGGYGGGLDIANEALHYAFRSEELTYKKTELEKEIPIVFGVKTMAEVVSFFYPDETVKDTLIGEITPIVVELANNGDEVSREILIRIGETNGYMVTGVMKQIGMEEDSVPVVLGGKVFDHYPEIFVDAFLNKIHEFNPNAYLVKPQFPPYVGAYLSALDKLEIKQTSKIEENLKRGCKK